MAFDGRVTAMNAYAFASEPEPEPAPMGEEEIQASSESPSSGPRLTCLAPPAPFPNARVSSPDPDVSSRASITAPNLPRWRGGVGAGRNRMAAAASGAVLLLGGLAAVATPDGRGGAALGGRDDGDEPKRPNAPTPRTARVLRE